MKEGHDLFDGVILSNGTSTIAVDYSGATILPAGATISLGDFVEVHGTFASGRP
jgi:hypothetical protein